MKMSNRDLDRQRVLWVKNSHNKCVEYERRLLEGEDILEEAYEYVVYLFTRIEEVYPELIWHYKIYTQFDDPIREVVLFNVVSAKCVAANVWYLYNIMYIKKHILTCVDEEDDKEENEDNSDELDHA